MKAPKGKPAGVKVTIQPMTKTQVDKARGWGAGKPVTAPKAKGRK